MSEKFIIVRSGEYRYTFPTSNHYVKIADSNIYIFKEFPINQITNTKTEPDKLIAGFSLRNSHFIIQEV